MVKVTYTQIRDFRNNSRSYLMSSGTKRSKLHYAIDKMIKRTDKPFNDYVDKEQEIRVELAEVDKDGMLIVDEKGNYRYKKEGAKQLQSRLRELGRTEVEIEPYYASELPKDLNPAFYEFFVPFVIEDEEPKEVSANQNGEEANA